jgi:hypothetical protein
MSASRGCRGTAALSASIAVNRPQAEVFGGRFDSKSGVSWIKILCIHVLIGAGDN